MDRGDWDMASRFVDEAVTLGAGRFDGYPSYAEVRVAIARMLLHDGDVRAVRRELAKAAILRPALTAAAPVIALTALLGLARLHLAVADPAGAKAVLTQAGDILRRRTDLGTLPVQVAELRATVTGLPVGLAGASALTTAELRVLQLLPYYLSFKEIAQRLGVKATTIKTHALSIYGKLGASSRGEAVEVAVEAGLLEWFTGFGHPSTDAPEMARVLGDDIDAALEELDPS